ncbi:hypothetical protein GLAREA_06622 [Glarea lozoyensis ATCC 20868]|uniref:Heterokaryon incompatibility domain-containing protein n=1 Tax=Glarea lozoyensis (strain ATCC 20868 / MF5171) TaxID=1116229 RepID=S3D8Z1_GLAL2|nr:uncharacterized protein GLAREA_06622 [Glarea lozoyensis ATCC 20868]EPE33609.1 hypothetical protein GLAREA_06622 [Glarea lozoyensis ATCC 20868]
MLCACCQAIDLRGRAKDIGMWSLADHLELRDNKHDSFRYTRLSYHSTLEAMFSAISQGCEFCELLCPIYDEAAPHLRREHAHFYPNGSSEAMQSMPIPLDSRPNLRIIKEDHCSITPATLIKLDPKYKKVLRKAIEEGSENQRLRQSCALGLQLGLSTPNDPSRVINVAILGLLADKNDPLVQQGLFGSREATVGTDFSLAKAWLQRCSQDHNSFGCKSDNVQRPLPTRVIFVGDNVNEVALCETSGGHGRFAALSHCWGEQAKWTTTKQHPKLPPYDDFPGNFQDAIVLTRKLGIRYLWIDALCILQDCIADWQKECADMTNIYRNAEVTISVQDNPSSSNTGFLKTHATSAYKSFDWHGLRVSQQASASRDPFGSLRRTVIDSRGWILQERLLSRRILHFSKKMMSWECSQAVYKDDFHYPMSVHPRLPKHQLFELDTLSKFSLCEYWHSVVEDYSTRSPTISGDKFPAISGLAALFAQAFRAQYIAGLWCRRFVLGLCWRVIEPTASDGDASAEAWVAPSWSWAFQRNVCWAYSYDVDMLEDAPHLKSVHRAMMVKSYDISIAGHDPFGALKSASVLILGKLQSCSVVQLTRRGPSEGKPRGFYVVDHDGCPLGTVDFDDLSGKTTMSTKGQSGLNQAAGSELCCVGVFTLLVYSLLYIVRNGGGTDHTPVTHALYCSQSNLRRTHSAELDWQRLVGHLGLSMRNILMVVIGVPLAFRTTLHRSRSTEYDVFSTMSNEDKSYCCSW